MHLTAVEFLHPRSRTLETVGRGDVEHQEAVDVRNARFRADVGRQQVCMSVGHIGSQSGNDLLHNSLKHATCLQSMQHACKTQHNEVFA